MQTFADEDGLHRYLPFFRRHRETVALLFFELDGPLTPDDIQTRLRDVLDHPLARMADGRYAAFFLGGDDVRAAVERVRRALHPLLLTGGLATLRPDSMYRGLIVRAAAALDEARRSGGIVLAPKHPESKSDRNKRAGRAKA